jgi:hypothetical protein
MRVIAAATAVILACVLAAVALAAAPLPKPASAFSTGGFKHGVSLTLVSSVDGKKIEAGGAALGSQFALSGGAVQCPKAKKSKGFHEVPFAIFGFPGAKLKLSHGTYGFSKSITEREAVPLGSEGVKPFTLKVKIAATVTGPTAIAGTVKASGGPCKSKKPIAFKAKLDPKLPVAPGK